MFETTFLIFEQLLLNLKDHIGSLKYTQNIIVAYIFNNIE
jgi:hypothetical protein